MDNFLEDQEEVPAIDMLRAFEDKHFGCEVPRVAGAIEKGHGSKYQLLDPAKKAHHDALTKFVEAEKAVSDAHAAHAKAKVAYTEAKAALSSHG